MKLLTELYQGKKEIISNFIFLIIIGSISIVPPNIHVQLSLALFFVLALVNGFNGRDDFKERIRTTFPLMVLFGVYGLSVFYSEDVPLGLKLLENKASLFIVPVLLALIKVRVNINWVMIYFSYSLVALFVFLVFQITLSRETFIWSDYFYENLVSNLEIHQTYLATYLSISILFLLNKLKNPLNIITVLILLLFLLFLQVRSSFIILIMGIIVLLVINFNRSQFKRGMMILTTFIILLLSIKPFQQRVVEVFQVERNNLIGSNKENGVTQRLFFWLNGLELIKAKPLFGYGLGDAQHEINSNLINQVSVENAESVNRALVYFAKENRNMHSQYLEVFISTGLLGLISLLWLFVFPILQSKRVNKDIQDITIIFLLSFFILFFFESGLERYSGIFFFSIFYCFILQNLKKQNV